MSENKLAELSMFFAIDIINTVKKLKLKRRAKMKNKILCLLMVVVMTMSMSVLTFAEDNINVVIDGKQIGFDVPPQIISGRTMVPIRAIFENMGATVQWDSDTSSAICTKGDTIVKMTVNSTSMYVNNQLQTMDIAPVEIDGRTLAPARYVAEALGADVQWSQKNNTVVICSKDVYAYGDYPDVPDLGRCYNIKPTLDATQDAGKVYTYDNAAIANEEQGNISFAKSLRILGNYTEEIIEETDTYKTVGYAKQGETINKFYVSSGYYNNERFFSLLIPTTTLFALDGRTITVFNNEVSAYLNVGWYETIEETQQTMYAPDGRTILVYKAEVPAYKNVGWYETSSEAQSVNKPVVQNKNNQGKIVYVGKTGTKYHYQNCRTLKKGAYPMSLDDAIAEGRAPCKVCH